MDPSPSPVRVVVVDDDPRIREALIGLLQDRDVDVVGEAGDGREAVDVICAVRPDVVVMDVRMPGIGGVEATRRLRSRAPGAAVVMLTAYDDDALHRAAREAGAVGYLVKGSPPEVILEAVGAAAGRPLQGCETL
jgi:DNA-binding NarL/FixJ family response regulator